MPHDAIDRTNVTLATVRVHKKHSGGYDPGWATYVNGDISTLTHLSMPASVNNPIRTDGTRAPSPFWTKRIAIANPGDTAMQSNPWPAWTEYMFESTRVCRTSELPWASIPDLLAYLKYDLWSNVDSQARTKFLNKLADASGKDQVSLGVIAGEFRETVGLAADLAHGIANGVVKVARDLHRAPATVGHALDSVRSLGMKESARRFFHGDTALLEAGVAGWLTVQFGLKPLVYDLYAAGNKLRASTPVGEALPLTLTLKAGAQEEYEYVRKLSAAWTNGASDYDIYGRFRQTTSVHYAGTYQVPSRPSTIEGWGLYNPASIGWELLRFSWMADYVVGIGDWLRSMMAAEGTQFVEGTRSLTHKIRLESLYSASANPLTKDPTGPMMVEADDFERVILNHGVMPAFLPAVKKTLGLPQLANSLAALATLAAAKSRVFPPII